MNKVVIISGNAGFVGSHVQDLFIQNGFAVYGIDNFSTGSEENMAVWPYGQTDGDVSDFGVKLPVVDARAIIHLAAQPSLLNSVKHPLFDARVNIIGTIRMANLAQLLGSKFIFASTSAIYDDMVNHMDESSVTYGQPGSPYGVSKLAAEHYINLLMPNNVIFRFANIYGERQVPLGENQLIPRAIRHILYGDDFEVYGDGKDVRDYMYVGDVAKAILKAVESDIVGTFNLSTGVSTSTNDVLETIKNIAEWGGEWKHGEERDGRRAVYMDNKKFKKAFGTKNFTSLEKGLEKTIAWWRKQ